MIKKFSVSFFSFFFFCNTIIISQEIGIDSLLIEDINILGKSRISNQSQQKIVNYETQIIPRLDQFLQFSPGVEMQSGALNTNRINIRGIGSRSPFSTSKIRAYLDDIPLTDGAGETSLEDINLGIIRSIDVFKGPISTLYGGGLGGSILLNSSKGNADQGIKFTTENIIGSNGLFRSNSDIYNKWNNLHNSYVNIESYTSDGYRDNNKYGKKSFTAFHRYSSQKQFISLFVHHTDLKAQIPSSLNIDDFTNSPKNAAANWKNVEGNEDNKKTRIGLSFNRILSEKSSFVLSLFTSVFDGYEIRPFNVLDEESTVRGLRTRYIYDNKKWNIVSGLELYYEKYDWEIFQVLDKDAGIKLSSNTSDRNLWNGFYELNYSFHPKLNVGTGLNVNSTKLSIDEKLVDKSTNKDYGMILSPTLFLHYFPTSMFTSSIHLGRGYSLPGIDESLDEDGNFIDDINQEVGWNLEWSNSIKLSKSFNILTSLFLMQVSDILVNRRTENGANFVVNAGNTQHMGWETKINYAYNFKDNLRITFNLVSSLGSYTFKDFKTTSNFSGNELTGVAKNKGALLVKVEGRTWYFSLNSRYSSGIPINDANTAFSDAYLIQNLLLNKDLRLRNLNIGLRFGVENLFNKSYASMVAVNARGFGGSLPRYYYPGNARSISAGIKIEI